MEKDLIQLHRLQQQGNCCASSLVALGLKCRGEENAQLVEAASGLCLGVRSGLVCGALTGGALCLSLFDPQLASASMIPQLTAWFRQTCGEAYGGTDCEKILAGDPLNKAVRCPGIVENVWIKVREILEDEGFDPESGLEEE